jgi:hypothetical protein
VLCDVCVRAERTCYLTGRRRRERAIERDPGRERERKKEKAIEERESKPERAKERTRQGERQRGERLIERERATVTHVHVNHSQDDADDRTFVIY